VGQTVDYPTLWGVPDSYTAFFLRTRLSEHAGTLVHIARDDAAIAVIGDVLNYLEPGLEILRFPAWDCLPYDRVSPHPVIIAERADTLSRLLDAPKGRRVVLTTVAALVQRVTPRDVFQGQTMRISVGESCDPETLIALLIASGYSRTDTVREPGEFASRGGIFDLFPPSEAAPLRIDLFGDEVENIRRFDVQSQISTTPVKIFELRPVTEYMLTPETVSRFRTGWRDAFGPSSARDTLYEHISEMRRHPGIEHYLPLFYPELENIFDYIPDAAVSADYQFEEILLNRLEMIKDHYAARRELAHEGEALYRALPPHRLYLDRARWDAMLSRQKCIKISPFAKPDVGVGLDAGARAGLVFTRGKDQTREGVFQDLKRQLKDWAAQGRRVYITAWSTGSRTRIAALLGDHGLVYENFDPWADAAGVATGIIGLIILGLERGFIADRVVFITEQDLLGGRIARPPRRKRKADQFISEAAEINEGDLVVHADYGIGRYEGLETISVGVAPHDCLRLLYDNDQKLYLPVENIELLSRFGSEQNGVALDRLGGPAWQARKAKMKERIRDMAAELIRTAAGRSIREAPNLAPPDGLWNEFCAGFPFIETDDQTRAISDVLEDLTSGKPMDRLICGDVGFGKTEVAIRAAFIAAMSGVQVAVVVPTTLLARQHYRSFTSRFSGFPIQIAQLSRLVSAAEATRVRDGLAAGRVDIVIGTHALLAKTIKFANLGLLIIDEEQHFGVAHKERLKALREDVHVLTLSATPLPRTLQLALTGVREMSLIATPPTDRLAVRTFITPFDSVMIREAIQRERFRGGQIFCVVPRVEDMERMSERLREIVPDAKIVQAHGRLAASELERVMTEFSDGKHDILLSTNIVESGLDMPAVNTLIIHRADMFGLGQLYQLRGRVGRGKQRGYAYLTWPQTHPLSPAAEKRLEIMQSLDSLGAGFTLAAHDLDLRGAGNLLGEEQSGHIKEVGIELYQQMLEDAVGDLRHAGETARARDEDWTPIIVLGLPVLIPEAYVKDLPVRLGLYRRIGVLEGEAEVDAMRAEMIDRFGPIPPEVENLLSVIEIKKACRRAHVERVEVGPKGMVIQFRKQQFPNPDGLTKWIARNAAQGVKLRADHKLAIVREMTNAQRIAYARKVTAVLARMVEKKTGAP